MLALQQISLGFGDRTLFEEVAFNVGPRDRIGLVGLNGTGKSTLLRIIAGIQQSDDGRVAKAHFVTVGYLPQEGISSRGRTLFAEVQTAFENVLEIEEELVEAQNALATSIADSQEQFELLDLVGELQHKLEDLDSFRMKSKIERVLMGLGFGVLDFERLTDEFSGGWQMRIELAKLLLREPSVLLLDEPTNHLDLDSLQWLEEYLHNYNGAVILVSHDRAFLDSLCTRTFAIVHGQIDEYAGNYSFYEKEHIKRRELLQNQFKNQQQHIKETQAFIERFRYKATKARQVQSRIKQLEKLDRIEVESNEETIHFRFPPPPSCGRVVMEMRGVSKSFGSMQVYSSLDLTIERGDKIAVVGINGAGKSTLARMLAGIEVIDGGKIVLGHNVTASYFAQHQAEELDASKEVLQVVDDVAEGEIRKRLRSLLGSFLFHDDDVFKTVGVLSGGEKSRLALAKMLLQPANVLIMDEPTNHLDMRSKEVLQEALQNFEGTFLIVSHDRAFLDPIVNKVLEVSKSGTRIFLGNVSYYINKKQEELLRPEVNVQTESAIARLKQERKDGQRRSIDAERERQRSKELRQLKKQLANTENTIADLERKKSECETKLADPSVYHAAGNAKELLSTYKMAESQLNAAYDQWNALTDKIGVFEEEKNS